MTQFYANIRVVVRVPFDHSNEVDDEGNSQDRKDAANYSEKVLLEKIKTALASVGEPVIELCVVEEVSSE